MKDDKSSVLLIEDNAGDARLIKELLAEARTGAFRLERADRLSAGLASIDQGNLDLVLLDLSLPDSDGLATVAAVRKHAPQLPVIVLTGHDDDRLAIAAVGAGAQDYLVKGRINGDSLARSIRYAIERKRVADALKEASLFTALLLQTSPLGMDIVDEDGTVLFVSPGLEALVGESPVGKRCWEVYRDDRQQCEDCPLKLGIDVGDTRSMESLGILGERDFEISHTGMVYRGRKAVLEVFHDITERKRAEEALRQSESRLSAIVEGTQALLMSVDANGHFTYANEATARAVGYASPEELIGKPYLHFIHPEDRQQVLDTFTNQANARQPSSLQEFRIVDTEGTVKWFSFLSTLAIEDGQVVGQSGVAQDITERKRAEFALKKAAADWQTTFDATTDGIYVLDSDHRIIRTNKAWTQMLDIRADEAAGKFCYQIMHARSEPIPDCPMLQMKRSGQRESLEYNIGERCLEFVVDPILDAHGTVAGAVHIIRDITARKRTEEQLNSQLNELQRWQDVMLGREDRVRELKREVNELRRRAGEAVLYPSQQEGGAANSGETSA